MWKAIGVIAIAMLIPEIIQKTIAKPDPNKKVTETTIQVQEAAKDSAKKASALGTAINNRELTVEQQLQEFALTSDRLEKLSEQLVQDEATYMQKFAEELKAFDGHAQEIQDTTIKQNMTTLRRKMVNEHEEFCRNARETYHRLTNVRAKARDLQEAAKCVVIANNSHTRSQGIEESIRNAQRMATEYENTTNALIGQINNIFVAQK